MRLYLLENPLVVPTQYLCLLLLKACRAGVGVQGYGQENGILIQALRDLYDTSIFQSQPAGYHKPDTTGWGLRVFLYTITPV